MFPAMDEALGADDPTQALCDLLNKSGKLVPEMPDPVHMFKHCEDDRDEVDLQAGLAEEEDPEWTGEKGE